MGDDQQQQQQQRVRQRGKKKSKQKQQQQQQQEEQEQEAQQQQQQPSWILSEQEHLQQQQQPEGEVAAPNRDDSTPFGLVQPEIKSYFRTAHADLIAASASSFNGDDDNDDQQQQQHDLLLNAALQELSGHELALATDPDTSVILEYIIAHIQPIKLRILTDRLSGNLFTLSTHRFGSHVVEAILTALQSSTSGHAQQQPLDIDDIGTLRSASQLIIDLGAELQAAHPGALSELLHHPFGTHVVRSLLSVLSGRSLAQAHDTRSKRSAAFRQKEGVSSRKGKGREQEQLPSSSDDVHVPREFEETLQTIADELTSNLDSAAVNALSYNPVAAPTLGLLLELELRSSSTDSIECGHLLDLLLGGIPSLCVTHFAPKLAKTLARQGKKPIKLPAALPERSDHMESALRDSVASHLVQRALELLAQRARASPMGSARAFIHHTIGHVFWRTYVLGRTANLAAHPSANFVLQACVGLLGSETGSASEREEEEDELWLAMEELRASGTKLVDASSAPLPSFDAKKPKGNGGHRKNGKAGMSRDGGQISSSPKTENRTGLLHAVLLRAGHLGREAGYESKAVELVLSAFGLASPSEDEDEATKERRQALVVPCILSMRTRAGYEQVHSGWSASVSSEEEGGGSSLAGCLGIETASLPGSLLLQAMIRMEAPANQAVLQSLLHPLHGPGLVLRTLAKTAPGSHVLLTALGSSTTPFKERTTLFRALLPLIVDITVDEVGGKWGSRVADAVWDWADPFFKDKIASEALKHERTLLSSHFGNFFLKRINVALYRRDPRKWREEYVAKMERKGWVGGLREEGLAERSTEMGAAGEAAVKVEVNGNGVGKKRKRGEQDESESGTKDSGEKRAEKSKEKKKKKHKQSKAAAELDSILSILPD
ncbi:hypothetical protein V8E36_004057 [Tilletia maclaganii]